MSMGPKKSNRVMAETMERRVTVEELQEWTGNLAERGHRRRRPEVVGDIGSLVVA